MGWFGGGGGGTTYVSSDTKSAEKEKDTAVKKSRLLETEGGNKGAQLGDGQGRSVRKIFGN